MEPTDVHIYSLILRLLFHYFNCTLVATVLPICFVWRISKKSLSLDHNYGGVSTQTGVEVTS